MSNVVVTGIESRPEFNGQKGTIRGWQSDTGRYAVQLASGQAMGLLPSKVQLPVGTNIMLTNLSSDQFNGRRGTITSYDEENGRYVVKTFSSDNKEQALKVKRENVKV